MVDSAISKKALQSRQVILDAASSLFLENGIGALSARAIASRAGVSTMGIYSHFNGKQGILDALYIEGFELVSQTLDVVEKLNGVERLLQAGDQYLEMGDVHEAHYRLIFGEADNGYQPSEQAARIRVAAFKKLVAVSSDLLAQSGLSAERHSSAERYSVGGSDEGQNPENGSDEAAGLQFALEVWALLHGFVSLKHHTLGEVDLELGGSATGSWDWKQAARKALLRLASSYNIK